MLYPEGEFLCILGNCKLKVQADEKRSNPQQSSLHKSRDALLRLDPPNWLWADRLVLCSREYVEAQNSRDMDGLGSSVERDSVRAAVFRVNNTVRTWDYRL